MDIKQAYKYNRELQEIIGLEAEKIGLRKEQGENLVEKYVDICVNELPMMGMLDLKDNRSVTVKLGNVLVNQKELLLACFEGILSFTVPNDILGYIQLLLLTIATIGKATIVELNEVESYIVAYLHTHCVYGIGEDENVFYEKFVEWYKKQIGDDISIQRIRKAIDNLVQLKSVEIVEGKIVLCEQVFNNKILE